MAIVVESVSPVAVVSSSTTISITKPSGLSEGDLMVASLSAAEADGAGVGGWATLSGWSLANSATFGSAVSQSVQYKVATSGDVAASNFTFTGSATTSSLRGVIFRCSGAATGASVTDALGDVSTYSNPGANSGTFAGTLTSYTPPADGSLVIAMPCVEYAGPGSVTFSEYSITSGVTPIEAYQGGSNDGGGGAYYATLYGIQTTAAALTEYGAGVSISVDDHYGTFAVFIPAVNQTVSNDLLEVQPTTFQPTVTNNTTGSNALLEVSPTINEANGKAVNNTQWSNPDKPSTDWDNLDKP